MKLAIFDFDGTLYPQQVVPQLMTYYTQNGYSKAHYRRYMMKVGGKILKYKNPFIKAYGKELFRRDAATLFAELFNGQSEETIIRFFEESAQVVIEQLDQQVVEEVKRCKEEGFHTVLLSGCYTPLLQKVAAYAGIEGVIGTELKWEVNPNNQVQLQALDIATGHRKVEKLLEAFRNQSINWEDSTAYGDSSYDRNILELVGNPVAVRPDEALKALALEKKWRIMDKV